MLSKKCRNCGKRKKLKKFYSTSRGKVGGFLDCILCVSALRKAHRAANPELYRLADKKRKRLDYMAEYQRKRRLRLKNEKSG